MLLEVPSGALACCVYGFSFLCVLLSVGLHPEFVMIPPKSVVPSLCGLHYSPCGVSTK